MIELSRGTFAALLILAILGVLGCINLARDVYALRHELARLIKATVRDVLSRPDASPGDIIETIYGDTAESDARLGDWIVCMVDDRRRKMMLPELVEALTKYPERVAWVESPIVADEETAEVTP